MESIAFLLEFTGGLILLVGSGCLIGYLLKLEKFSDERQESKDFQMTRTDGTTNKSDD